MKRSVLVACWCLLVLACGSNENMDIGLEKLKEGEYELAMLRFTNVAKEEPQNLEAHYYAAMGLLLNEDFKGALEYGEKMMELYRQKSKKKFKYELTVPLIESFYLVLKAKNGQWDQLKDKRPELVPQLEQFCREAHEFIRLGAADILGRWRLKWKFDTMGRVMSKPLVVDDEVYIASDAGNLFAIHADDGTVYWTYETNQPFFNNSPFLAQKRLYVVCRDTMLEIDREKGALVTRYPDISTQPTLDGDVIYATYSPSILKPDEEAFYVIKRMDRKSRRISWQKKVDNEFCFFSPVLHQGILYVQASNNLYALQATSGKPVWEFKLYSRNYPRFALIHEQSLILSSDKFCYRIGLKDGKEEWKYQAGGEIESAPTLSEGTIYFGCNDSHLYALGTDGKLQWKVKTYGGIVATPLIRGPVVYVGSEDQNLYAFDKSNGALKWKYLAERGVVSCASQFQDLIIVGSNDGNVYAFSEKITAPKAGEKPAEQAGNNKKE